MADPVSRYGIVPDDLAEAFLVLNVGSGMQALLQSPEATRKIVAAEDWADGQASDRVGVPLKPVPAPGQVAVDPVGITRRNFPFQFTQAILYYAAGLLLQDVMSETQPAASQQGQWAVGLAIASMEEFKDNPAMRLGRGRRKHYNPHMPPQIAPRERKPENTQGQGGFPG